MKSNKNVVFDFTQNNSQPLAIMSAPLAKKLLEMMARHLSNTHSLEIIEQLIQNLRNIDVSRGKESVAKAIEVAAGFVEERGLIENIVAENWDAYKVEQIEPEEVRSNNEL